MQFIDGKLSAVQLYGCIPYKIEICICEKFVRKINGMASSNKMCHAASARGSVSAAGWEAACLQAAAAIATTVAATSRQAV